MEIIPAEAEAIQRAAQALLDGQTLSSVAAGMPPRERAGRALRPWRSSELRSLLISPRLAALSAYDLESAYTAARASRGDTAAAIFSSVVAPAIWPAILDETLWRDLVRKLCDPKRRITPGSAPAHLLSGLVSCGVAGCGAPLRVSTAQRPGQPKRQYYRCFSAGHSRRPMDVLEDIVIGRTLDVLENGLTPPPLEPDSTDTPDTTSELARLRDKLSRLAEQYAADDITDHQFTLATAKTRARIAALEATAKPVTMSPELREIALAPSPREMWPTLPLESRRAILRALWTIELQPYPVVGSDAGRLAFNAAKKDPAWGIQMVPTWQ